MLRLNAQAPPVHAGAKGTPAAPDLGALFEGALPNPGRRGDRRFCETAVTRAGSALAWTGEARWDLQASRRRGGMQRLPLSRLVPDQRLSSAPMNSSMLS